MDPTTPAARPGGAQMPAPPSPTTMQEAKDLRGFLQRKLRLFRKSTTQEKFMETSIKDAAAQTPEVGDSKPENPPEGDLEPDQSSAAAAHTQLNSPQILNPRLTPDDTSEPSNRSLSENMDSPAIETKAELYSPEPQRNLPAQSPSPSTPSRFAPSGSTFAPLPTQDLTSTPFADATICAAVDISTSTRGLILSQEALAVSTIGHQLSQEAKNRGRVLPWSNVGHPMLRLTDSAGLKPSYGTDPSVICSYPSFSTVLRDCSLWLLLTDGMIDEEDIERFASGVAEKGLHGTACVIILFGYLPRKPIDLNTSVGVSVFAVAPNCLFLFHDVDSSKVYVLQCKGCYTSILPELWENPSLGVQTKWSDLPEIEYEQLAQLNVPKPIKLDKDDVALANGKIINMRNLYQDRLDPQSVTEIFGNDDNMKTVLLTAATRGHSDKVESWLAKQESSKRDSYVKPRPDIDGRALVYTQQLLDLMRTEHTEKDKIALQTRLQEAHVKNWKAFREFIDQYNRGSAQHNIIVRDSIARVNDSRGGMLSSPAILSPVSPPQSVSSVDYNLSPIMRRTRRGSYSMDRPPAQHARIEEPDYLYTTNYRRRVDGYPDSEHRGDCALCGASKSPMALLLKKPDPDMRTEGLPPSGSRTKLAFPLAMGNFPETDIISLFVCCDPCSYFVTTVGKAPLNENIVGAVILTNLQDNRNIWRTALAEALEYRFADEDLELLFLAILYTTLQDIDVVDMGPTTTASNALLWTISQLQRNIDISMTLSRSFDAANTAVSHSKFYVVLTNSFLEVSKPQAPLLKYPIEGFAILVQAIENIHILETRDIHNALFQRFLFHLTEQYQAFLPAEGRPVPVPVEELLAPTASAKDSSNGGISITGNTSSQPELSSVSVSSLCGGPLLSEEALTVFRSMGSCFSQIEKSGAEDVATFLFQLVQTPKQVDEAFSCFDHLRSRLDLQSMSQKTLTLASQV